MLGTVLLLCGLSVQSTLCVCIYPGYFGCIGRPLPRIPYNAANLPAVTSSFTPLTLDMLAANKGGSFKVVSSSPIAPTGISLLSKNTMEGNLLVSGEIPFLGSVVLEGSLPAAGKGDVDYGCGGTAAVLSEFEARKCTPTVSFAPACTGIEIAIPASIPAEIVAPLYDCCNSYPSGSLVVLPPSAVAPKATAIGPVIGRFGFKTTFGRIGLGCC